MWWVGGKEDSVEEHGRLKNLKVFKEPGYIIFEEPASLWRGGNRAAQAGEEDDVGLGGSGGEKKKVYF